MKNMIAAITSTISNTVPMSPIPWLQAWFLPFSVVEQAYPPG